eukprot:Tamp_02717.p1 GENE.Tamp_02717~~Tamp_02717.p1  ORF type:complete len:384 (-),score=76.37 Tamp_02717:2992-4059(-)
MQHLRKKKVMQRKRTRDLYYALDPLVPVRGELVLGEKGSLPSRRTFLQLQNDARAHLRDLKVQRDAAASRRPAGPGAKSDSAAAGGAGGGSAALHRSMMREGMLASSQLLLLEVSTASWAVLRTSRGLRLLFSKHPRGACAIEGECLLHYVEAQDTSVLRAACRAPVGAGAPEFTIGLRTFEASFTTIRKCRVQRIASHLPEQQLFMLSLLVAVPRPVRPDWGWSVAKMRDMCGIYEFDTKSPFAATLPPWQVEPIFDSVERDFVNGAPAAAMLSSWNAVAELAVRSNIVTAELLQRLVGPSLVWSSWTEHCRKLLHGLVQLHVFFDVKSDSNGMYAYAQAYPLRPPDAMVCNMV